MRNRFLAGLLGLIVITTPAFAEEPEILAGWINSHPATSVEMKFSREQLDEYRQLAARIGFNYEREYRYRSWVDIKRMNDVAIAGEYEWLACSTGEMGPNELCPTDDAGNPDAFWESMYYKNHDMTALHVMWNEGDRTFVQFLKFAEGRAPDLHLR